MRKEEVGDWGGMRYEDMSGEKVEKGVWEIDDGVKGVDGERKMKGKVKGVRK